MNSAVTPAPVYEQVIRPRSGWVALDLRELWRYRELFLFLAWRDILVRYKQTYIGIAWAFLQPFLTVVVFTVIFGHFAKIPSEGAPYAVMNLAGLIPWMFFSNAMSESSNSLIASQNMITKIYFPRLIIPASSTLSGTVDFVISLGMMGALMLCYDVAFTARLLLLPVFFLVAFLAAFGVGLWLSALSVKYRDVKYVVPFFVRIGLYASPVAFSSSLLPAEWQVWYNLYPVVGVIDGFRWCILGDAFEPNWGGFVLGILVVLVTLVSGAFYFRKMERTFADVI
ncbi:MAG: ABC transporter permease [Verrucomicrobiota bacterium]